MSFEEEATDSSHRLFPPSSLLPSLPLYLREGIATAKLARLYRDDEEESKAARCYQRHLETRQGYQVGREGGRERRIEYKR